MTITFQLRFRTHTGQSLWLAGSHPLPARPVPLHYVDQECWQVTIPLAAEAAESALNYSYILRQPDGAQITDWGHGREVIPAGFKAAEPAPSWPSIRGTNFPSPWVIANSNGVALL